MIYCLSGTLVKKNLDMIVISCAGVGYQMLVPSSTSSQLPAVGNETTVYTYMNISENAVSLFGFADEEQKACFEMLINVSGVGPKAGLAILNALSPSRITLAISSGDHKAFTAANGVGPKLAQRIVLELKDKVAKGLANGLSVADITGGTAEGVPTGNVGQAIAALTSLGYTPSDAAAAVAKLDETLPVEDLIKLALRNVGGRR